jgi:hypothetical protein
MLFNEKIIFLTLELKSVELANGGDLTLDRTLNSNYAL